MIHSLAVQIPDGWVAVVGAGLVSWLAYMARQVTVQASLNERVTSTLERLSDDFDRQAREHADLKRAFYGHVDAEKDQQLQEKAQRIQELEMQLAAASRFPARPPD